MAAADKNKYGLKRYIPSDVARKVRKRSKFGCVICRCGIYQYEHIDPPFESATKHDPDKICCLCGKCHELVTRGHLSKAAVSQKYLEIHNAKITEVSPPTGPLDFFDGNATLRIGGIDYDKTLESVVRYYGQDVMVVRPGKNGRPGEISAIFCDESGNTVLELNRNEWRGSLDAWDIDVEGRRLIVRRPDKSIVLSLFLNPPGRVIIDRLDMRIGNAHLLISDQTHAIGRYLSEDQLQWLHAGVGMISKSGTGVAVEFTDVESLRNRYSHQKTCGGQYMADGMEDLVIGNYCGVMVMSAGLAVGTMCGTVRLTHCAVGTRPLDETRRVVFRSPEKLPNYLGSEVLD